MILGSHGSEYKDDRLLGYCTVQCGVYRRFRNAFASIIREMSNQCPSKLFGTWKPSP